MTPNVWPPCVRLGAACILVHQMDLPGAQLVRYISSPVSSLRFSTLDIGQRALLLLPRLFPLIISTLTSTSSETLLLATCHEKENVFYQINYPVQKQGASGGLFAGLVTR